MVKKRNQNLYLEEIKGIKKKELRSSKYIINLAKSIIRSNPIKFKDINIKAIDTDTKALNIIKRNNRNTTYTKLKMVK